MDSRRCSAALGFTLLISCVIGIVILIHNSGSSRRSSELSTSSSTMQHNHNHQQRASSTTTIVGGKAVGGGDDHFVTSPKDGFANDPNYRSSQPTMQEVNDLADELHRLLSSKSKHVLGKGNPINTGTVTSVKKTNGSLTSSSATSSVKASITAVNYSNVPKKSSFGVPPGAVGSMTSVPASPTPVATSTPTNSSLPRRNHTLTSSSVNRQETRLSQQQKQNLQHNHHNHNQKPYPGHQSAPSFPPLLPTPVTTQMMVDSAERGALAPHQNRGRGGSGSGSLAHNDLYTTSWHPSMVSPAGGGMVAPNHSHHHHHLRNHPQSHRPHSHNNNPQPPRSSSPAKINKTGKGAGLPLNQNQNGVPNSKQYQYNHYRHDHEKEEMEQYEDGDFVEVDDDDEDDVSRNLDNLKKEEEWDDDNDVVDDNEEEEEDEEEEDEVDDGANPGFLLEPKNLAADLETLFSLANHLYTSPASLLSAFSAQAKPNSTKKTDNPISGFPAAFQGFLKVVNETIRRGNNSKLLVDLNEMYQGREARMSSDSNNKLKNKSNNSSSSQNQTSSLTKAASSVSDVMKNEENDKQESPYEKSLTAFVFMSFGVFLLNQIHSFVQKTADEHLKHHNFLSNDTMVSEGRALPWEEIGPFTWYSPRSKMMLTAESSSLDVLFQPPVALNKSSTLSENASNSVSGRSNDHPTVGTGNSIFGEDHLNNMFRAMLNIGNAYTKDSPALECIWSLYCQDLDQTAHKQGLYGVAARINSVGLRLIMKQIPPALTFDLILRSLVGWDGLPCRKMFPECSVGNGTISMVTGEEDRVGVKKLTTNVL